MGTLDPSPEEPPEGKDSFSPPVHPDDRLWRHPSEIGRYGARAKGRPVVDALRRFGPATLAGALSGVIVAAVVLFTMQALLTHRLGANHNTTAASGSKATTTTAPVSIDSAMLHAAVTRVARSLVAVTARGPGWSRAGSGTIVSPDGLVVTAASLTKGATSVTVNTGGRSYTARLRGADPDVGLALLSISASGLLPAPLAAPGQLQAGQWVVDVGASPQTSRPTQPRIAVGPVKALHQPLQLPNGDLIDTIQFDMPLAPTSPGGMLIDMQGNVVGIAIRGSEALGSTGIAAPARLVMSDTRQLAGSGTVFHGWLGVSGKGVPAGGTGSADAAGVVVSSVAPKSPAASAGLRKGDVVLAVDGQPTPDMISLRQAIRLHRPGEQVVLSVLRSGRTLTLPAVLAGTSE